MLHTLAIANYRSLRQLVLPLGRLNVITGANGSGKSSVYRALRLLAQTAQGQIVAALAREGGLPSTLWAGPEEISAAMRRGEHAIEGTRRKQPVHLRLGFASEELGYLIDLGLPTPGPTLFTHDPHIKNESIWAGPVLRPASLLVERKGPLVRAREDRDWAVLAQHLSPFDSMLTQLADPQRAPEMLQMREQLRGWRFYDHFRTDSQAPARQNQIGTHTPVLSDDGHDLAAALQTIMEIGDGQALQDTIDDAFPGTTVEISNNGARLELLLQQRGLLRPLHSAELSDGTLRYLLWVAALLSPRPPALLVLNEPETSLHPDLLPPLGRLIRHAARQAQIIVVTHANRLLHALSEHEDYQEFCLDKPYGETIVVGQHELDQPPWHWPAR